MENGREKMTVSGLGEGVYSFKVVVTGSDPVRAEGEGLGVVTVLPRESIIRWRSDGTDRALVLLVTWISNIRAHFVNLIILDAFISDVHRTHHSHAFF